MSQIDVIVPCYNYGDMLAACVGSVLAQQHVDVHVVIMDDASTDSTERVGRSLAASDRRVEYRRHAANRGHILTYNEALADVGGDYSVILSADDLLTPGSLSRATRFMDSHPDVTLAYGRDITFRHAPPVGITGGAAQCGGHLLRYHEFLERSCRLGHTGIQAPAAIARTSTHRLVGGYMPELPHAGDTEVWLRLAAHGSVAQLDADQAFRRLHTNNMSLLYAPLHRLEQQRKAFAAHFEQFRDTRPDIRPLEAIVWRTIAESAVWSASHAFDAGETETCEQFLAFAASLSPDIETWRPWRRLQWKRRIGAAIWRRLAPIRVLTRASAAVR
jgi:glycosyltransferase involved in cell wall biosynthesis